MLNGTALDIQSSKQQIIIMTLTLEKREKHHIYLLKIIFPLWITDLSSNNIKESSHIYIYIKTSLGRVYNSIFIQLEIPNHNSLEEEEEEEEKRRHKKIIKTGSFVMINCLQYLAESL